jgi:hypothetical protein
MNGKPESRGGACLARCCRSFPFDLGGRVDIQSAQRFEAWEETTSWRQVYSVLFNARLEMPA